MKKTAILGLILFSALTANAQTVIDLGGFLKKLLPPELIKPHDTLKEEDYSGFQKRMDAGNAEFYFFSKKYDNYIEAAKAINEKLAPQSIGDCRERKFKYKDICLGISIGDFSKIYNIYAGGLADRLILSKFNVVLSDSLASRRNRSGRQVDCAFESPSFDILETGKNPLIEPPQVSAFSFSLPIQYRKINCLSKDADTIFGYPVSSVYFEFFNERLYNVEIQFYQASFIFSLAYPEFREKYQAWFSTESKYSENISEFSEAVIRERKDLQIVDKIGKWTNFNDSSEFMLIGNRGEINIPGIQIVNGIKIHSPQLQKIVNDLRSAVSSHVIDNQKKKNEKDF